jgi:lipopolysaccharide biosynthesis glycosyltransferase
MDVVYASDDGYAFYLGVSLYSLLKNNRADFDEIKIFILDTGIKLENKEKLEKLCLDFNRKIYFYDVGEIEKKLGLSIKSNLPLGAYSRLFVSSLLDDDISKVIYLDSDSLVVGSFKEIWNCDISDYYCAGVLDNTMPYYKYLLAFLMIMIILILVF